MESGMALPSYKHFKNNSITPNVVTLTSFDIVRNRNKTSNNFKVSRLVVFQCKISISNKSARSATQQNSLSKQLCTEKQSIKLYKQNILLTRK